MFLVIFCVFIPFRCYHTNWVFLLFFRSSSTLGMPLLPRSPAKLPYGVRCFPDQGAFSVVSNGVLLSHFVVPATATVALASTARVVVVFGRFQFSVRLVSSRLFGSWDYGTLVISFAPCDARVHYFGHVIATIAWLWVVHRDDRVIHLVWYSWLFYELLVWVVQI